MKKVRVTEGSGPNQRTVWQGTTIIGTLTIDGECWTVQDTTGKSLTDEKGVGRWERTAPGVVTLLASLAPKVTVAAPEPADEPEPAAPTEPEPATPEPPKTPAPPAKSRRTRAKTGRTKSKS